MRKILQSFLMAVMTFICLTACVGSKSTGIYTVDERGTLFTVDTNNMTISDGTNTYHYTVEGSGLRYTTEITYPDGSTYWWTVERSGNFSHGYGGWSDDYDEDRYVAGDVLCDVLDTRAPEPPDDKNPILIMLLIVIGLFNLFAPQTSWYLSHGWKYKNAEPSEAAIGLNRFGGGAALVLALILILV